MALDMQEFNSLFSDPGNVSWPIKAVTLLALIGFVVFMGYKLVIVNEIEVLKTVERKELDLRVEFEKKQARANQLPAFKKQLNNMQTTFKTLKRQLPSGTEIPGLILDISDKGRSNGLEIDLFEPKPETNREFFAEKPISIIAKGTYNELASFVSDISGLPRIVTINDIRLEPEKQPKSDSKKNKERTEASSRLNLNATIKTYRYLEEDAEESDVNG